MRLLTVLIILFLSLAAAPASEGKGPGKAKGKGKHKDHAAQTEVDVEVAVFSKHDRDVVRSYYRGFHGNLPPGLAKRGGSLPPGLEKQLRRRGHLPPGLEKRISPFPVELENRLPILKPGLQRGFIGGRAVIYNRKTRAIVDVFAIL